MNSTWILDIGIRLLTTFAIFKMPHLGTNDYSTDPVPSDDQFTNGLVDFLNRIANDYPAAAIGAMCAPSARGNQCENIQKATTLVNVSNVRYLFITPDVYSGGYGCDYHPSAKTQQNIAAIVMPFVEELAKSIK
jgi:hypothetical protein